MSEEKENNQQIEKEDNKEELSKKQEEVDELTDRYKRVMAESENYKKRSQKEREMLYNMILSDIIILYSI